MFVLLYVFSRNKAGQVIVYYTAWLLALLLVVTHSDQIVSILSGGNF